MLKTVCTPDVNAKLKARYAKTLNRNDLENLMKQNNIKDAIILLKSKVDGLEKLEISANRVELEKSLDNIIDKDLKVIGKYLNNTGLKILEAYLMKYNMSIEFDNSSTKTYFSNFLKVVNGINKNLEQQLKIEMDLLDIIWTYRYTRKNKFNSTILLGKGYKINFDVLREIAKVKNIEEIKEVLADTYYANIYKNNIEKDFKQYLYDIYKRNFERNIFDISMVINYFEMLEIEKKNIITIIEGIRYSLPTKEIESKIII